MLVALVAFVYLGYAAALIAVAPCGAIGLANPGSRFVDLRALGLPSECAPTPDGYDGQFYWGIAMAAGRWLANHGSAEGAVALDLPATRLQRIGLPLLASVFGGEPRATALALLRSLSDCLILGTVGAFPWIGRHRRGALAAAALVLAPWLLLGASEVYLQHGR